MILPLRPALTRALIVSVLIHASLLLGVTGLVPIRPEAPSMPIQVVMSRARPGEHQKTVAPSVARPAREPDRPVVAPVRPVSPVVPKKVAVEKMAVAEQPSRDFIVPASPLPGREVVAPAVAVPATGGRAGSGASNAASAIRQEGVGAEDLRQYRTSLAMAARRFKRYPALAKERGWEGTAEIALSFNSLLPGPEVLLLQSSGRKVLDEQALEMVRQAARATSLPAGLQGRDFRVPLPVRFSLEEEQ